MAVDVEHGNVDVETGASSSRLVLGNLALPGILERSDEEVKLHEQVNSIDGDKVGRVVILSFRALQLYRIAKLQAALVKEQNVLAHHEYTRNDDNDKSKQNESTINGEEVDALIQRYGKRPNDHQLKICYQESKRYLCSAIRRIFPNAYDSVMAADAVRNYETLTQAIPFNKHTEYEFLGGNQGFKITKRKNISRWFSLRASENTVVPYDIGPLGFRELDRKRLEKRRLLMALKLRFHMALVGGTTLLVPVVLMALYRNLHTQLIITSVATVIFSLLVVLLGTDSNGKDILASTAAYTAVLVVFVGASNQSIAI
ncbi:hypothetical protein F4859DRAFT_520217 [Xylaria cf. heliscus]|nr:hypothetical protein F4859DRAFT_520217 [Xylaria cf. heliscus]